jgi:hypothetical protein
MLKNEMRVMEPDHLKFFKRVRTGGYSELIFNGISAGKLNQVLMGHDGYRISEPSPMTAQSASGILQCLEAFALFDGIKVCLTEPLVALLKVGGHEEVLQVLSYIHQAALLKSKRDLLIDIDFQKIVSEFNYCGYCCNDYWPEASAIKVNGLLTSIGVETLIA